MAGIFTATYNGLNLGVGTTLNFTEVVGLNDMPPVRSADETKAGDHGAFAGVDYLGPRTVRLGLFIQGASLADYDAQCDSVEGAFAVQPARTPAPASQERSPPVRSRSSSTHTSTSATRKSPTSWTAAATPG